MNDIARNEQLGEAAYSAMYDVVYRYKVKMHYEDACTYFWRAIDEARRLDQSADADRLTKRLDEIRAVYDSQFRNVGP